MFDCLVITILGCAINLLVWVWFDVRLGLVLDVSGF